MRLNWIVLVFIVVSVKQNLVSCLECTSSESVACREEVENLRAHKKKYQYATDNQTLTEMCRVQFLALKCVNAFAEECLSDEEQEIFKTLTNGSDAFFDYFCLADSELRNRYLKHASCIRSISWKLDECTKEYEESQKRLDDAEDGSQILTERTCCIYLENIRCSSKATSGSCGEAAGRLVTDLWKLLGGTYLNDVCQPYTTYDTRSCTPSSPAPRLMPGVLHVLFPFLYSAATTPHIR